MLHVDTLWDYAIRYNNIVASGEHSCAFACYASELWRLGSVNAWILLKWEPLKNLLYLSVNVFSTKILIGDTICTSPIRDWTAILRGYPSHVKVYPFAGLREYLHFSVILRPWVLVRPRESNPRPLTLQSSVLPTELILPPQEQRTDWDSVEGRKKQDLYWVFKGNHAQILVFCYRYIF